MLNRKSPVQLNPAQENTKVSKLNYDTYERVPEETLQEVILENYQGPTIFLLEKEGHFPENYYVFPKKVNPYKLGDLGFGLGMTILGATSESLSGEANGMFMIYGLMSLVSFAVSPQWIVNGGTYELPALKPYPVQNEGAPKLALGPVDISLGENDIRIYYYKSLKRFVKQKPSTWVYGKDEVYVKESLFSEDLKARLGKTGYIDTTSKLFSSRFVESKISAQLVSASIKHVGSALTVEGDVEWTLTNEVTGDTIARYTLMGKSVFHPSYISEEEAIRSGLANVFERTLYDFFEKPKVKTQLEKTESSFANLHEEWDSLKIIQNPDTNLSSAGQALASVVTVVDKNGHGSGVVIGSNGYIITNHHVVKDALREKRDLKIRFGQGLESTAEIIRTNPIFDLALIKIDAENLTTLSPLQINDIRIGEDVFAIGTPSSVDLGQTLSKGIISGKRVDNDQVTIQTDVPINGGNSGGALVYTDGSLLGIVNAKIVGFGVEGIGFAIPAEYIESALKIELERK